MSSTFPYYDLGFLELGSGSSKEGIVDLVDDIRGADRAVVEVPAVETLKGLLAARDGIEFDIDISIRVGINRDVDDLAVFLGALILDFFLELFSPALAEVLHFPRKVSTCMMLSKRGDLLIGVKGILNLDALRSHRLVDDRSAGFGHWLRILLRGYVYLVAGKVHHKLVAINLLEVHTSHVSIVQSGGTTDTAVISAVGAVEDAARATSISTTSTSAAEGRALVACCLLWEATEKVSGRFRSEFVVTKADTNLTTSELEAIHFCKSFLSVIGIIEPGRMLASTICGCGNTYWTNP